MKTKAFRIKIYRDAIAKAVVPGQIDRLMMSAACDSGISRWEMLELQKKANVKREQLLRKQYCWRRGCKYWRDPSANPGHSCDYMMLTGRSRIKQIPDPHVRKNFSRCPLFEAGKRKRLKTAKPIVPSRTKYDWDKARVLYDAGATDREIFETIGCTQKNVQWWRGKNKLPCNRADERDREAEP